VLDAPERVAVPAAGEQAARLRLLRSGAPAGSVQGLVVTAETLDEAAVGADAAPTGVEVVAAPRWTERLRLPGVAVAVLLLLAGSFFEWRRARAA
jgi:hypothetical protein